MAHHPSRRIAGLRRFRRRCWAAVALCLLAQTGAATAHSWALPQRPFYPRFYLEFVQ